MFVLVVKFAGYTAGKPSFSDPMLTTPANYARKSAQIKQDSLASNQVHRNDLSLRGSIEVRIVGAALLFQRTIFLKSFLDDGCQQRTCRDDLPGFRELIV